MNSLYFVKKQLYGIAPGRVERFAPHKAGELVVSGAIEPYDEDKHGEAIGAPPPTKKSKSKEK